MPAGSNGGGVSSVTRACIPASDAPPSATVSASDASFATSTSPSAPSRRPFVACLCATASSAFATAGGIWMDSSDKSAASVCSAATSTAATAAASVCAATGTASASAAIASLAAAEDRPAGSASSAAETECCMLAPPR